MKQEPREEDPRRWEKVKDILTEAIETPVEARDSFIDGSCGFDVELKAEIRRLMEEYFQAGTFLSDPAVDLDEKSLAERPPRFPPSTVLAQRFKIVRFIARGGMGEVYEAEDLELGDRVALKTIRADIAADERILGLFKQEIQLARRVTHPNVCRIFDLAQHSEPGPDGPEEIVHFLTMELLEGQALSRYLKENGPFSPAEALPLIEQMATALQAAHDAGVIHRDFKPGNVVLIRRENGRENGSGFRVVVTDFGLALPLLSDHNGEDGMAHRAGTPEYMAPEQIEGGPITPAADLYSFGLVIVETVGGKNDADEGSRLRTLLRARAAGEGGPLSLPVSCRSWEPVLRRCLERAPERRFSTPVEVVEALRSADLRRRPVTFRKLAAGMAILMAVTLAVQPILPDQLRIPWLAGLLLSWSGHESVVGKGSSGTPPLDFRKRDWVLITHFENRTGEKLLDGTLEYALERELSNSRYVNVVPRERVEDTLALMRKPADTVLESTLGREICLRDGGIRAMVNGRIEKLGGTYQLSSVIVEPVRGVAVASQAEMASSEAEILGAVRRLSAWARERLGETRSAIEESTQALEKVSTPSLRALQLYSLADDDIRHLRFPEAELLLREALQVDPAFASAEILLAWAIRNQGRRDSDYSPHAKRAFELSAGCSARERYFIRGSYYWMKGMMEKAREQYETLIRLYPDHYWANNNLAYWYQESGDLRDSTVYWRRLSDLRPGSLSFMGRAGDLELRINGDLVRAREAASRIQRLHTDETEEQTEGLAAGFDRPQFWWADMLAFHEHWQAGRIDQAEAEVRRLTATIDQHHGLWRQEYASSIGMCFLTLGQIHQAQQVFGYMPELSYGSRMVEPLILASVREDPELLRSTADLYLTAPNPYLTWEPVVLLVVRAGFISRAEAAVKAAKPHLSAKDWQTVRGEIALARGDLDGAIRLLRETLKDRIWIWYPHYFMGCESLARALEKKGQLGEAILVLEGASRAKRNCYSLFNGHAGWAWLRNQEQLAQLYREAGRIAEAVAIEADLRHMLSRADPDFPMLVRLNRLRNTASLRPPTVERKE